MAYTIREGPLKERPAFPIHPWMDTYWLLFVIILRALRGLGCWGFARAKCIDKPPIQRMVSENERSDSITPPINITMSQKARARMHSIIDFISLVVLGLKIDMPIRLLQLKLLEGNDRFNGV